MDTFDLNDYKVIDYKYDILSCNFVLNGNNIGNFLDYSHSDQKTQTVSLREALRLNGKYSHYENSRKKQLSRYVNFTTAPTFNYNNNDDSKDKSFEFYSKMNFIDDRRIYYKDKLFVETGINFQGNQDYFYSRNDGNNSKSNSFNIDLNFPFGFGFGRIENITNVMQAYYIYKDLNANSLLNGNFVLNKDEIYELAGFITRRKSIRYFDYRLKLRDDIDALTNDYFASKANTTVSSFYSSLYDMWIYGDEFSRLTGRKVSFGILPQFHYMYLTNDIDSLTYKSLNFRTSLYTKYEFHKAINIKWQFDFSTYINGGMKFNYNDHSNSKWQTVPIAYQGARVGFGYYPDTRTHFNTSLGYSISYEDFMKGEDNIFNFSIYFRNSYYKYISPRLRLTLSLNISNKMYSKTAKNNSEKSNFFTLDYLCGINYYIF